MALGVELGQVYHASATLFQLSLAWLILRSGSIDHRRAGFALVIGFSGLETLVFLLRAAPFGDAWILGSSGVGTVLDTPLLWTLVYLLTQYPEPIGGDRGERIAARLWVAGLAAWPIASVVLAYLDLAGPEILWHLSSNLTHEGAFVAGAIVLAMWSIPRWLELEAGPLKDQSWLAIGGLGVSFLVLSGRWLERLGRVGLSPELVGCGGTLLPTCDNVYQPLVVWFSLGALLRVGLNAWGDRGRKSVYLTGVFGVSLVLGFWAQTQGVGGPANLATQVLRPMLIGAAMLRFDLFQAAPHIKRYLTPLVSLFLGLLLFLITAIVLSGDGLEASGIDPAIGATGLLVAVGTLALLREPLTAAAGAPGDLTQNAQPQRLERYRLALERARRRDPSPEREKELSMLREELGVSEEEHEVLSSLLAQHVLVPTSAVAGAQIGSLIADRFKVLEEIGRGGFGRVLLARDRDSDARVVVKEALRPWEEDAEERRASLEREARLVHGIESVNLAEIHGLFHEGHNTYLVREYVDGPTLEELVEGDGPLGPEQARDILQDVLEGLKALHREGVLHLDLKPANVVLHPTRGAVVIDYGAGRRDPTHEANRSVTQTQGRAEAGTLAWMAPEQVLGQPVDERADIFALGALVYYMLTGQLHVQVEGRSTYEVEDAIIRGSVPERLDGVPEGLAAVVEGALARETEERLRDVEEVLIQVETR